MASPITTDIDIINAALTATGNGQITSLEDGTAESDVAAANYHRLLSVEMTYPYSWTRATRRLARLDGTGTDTSRRFAYQVPAGFAIDRIEVEGVLVPWESWSDLILCNVSDAPVIAVGHWTPPPSRWPADFVSALITRLEALFLRALSEDYDKATQRDRDADMAFRRLRNADSRKRSPRRPGRSALLEARR